MWVAFAFAKANTKATNIFFQQKNTCELDIILTRAVNILTTNELVQLKMLWTTASWFLHENVSAVWGNSSTYTENFMEKWELS